MQLTEVESGFRVKAVKEESTTAEVDTVLYGNVNENPIENDLDNKRQKNER